MSSARKITAGHYEIMGTADEFGYSYAAARDGLNGWWVLDSQERVVSEHPTLRAAVASLVTGCAYCGAGRDEIAAYGTDAVCCEVSDREVLA